MDAATPPSRVLARGSDATSSKLRDPSLDLIRCLGSFLVIVIHACSTLGFYKFGRHWTAADLYDSVSRVSVPLFFMVSGALLLGRKTQEGELIRRLWKILLPLAAWSYLYFAWDHEPLDLLGWAGALVSGRVQSHLWFCYAILSLYLFLPVLRSIAQHAEPRYLVLAFLLLAANGANIAVSTLSNLLLHQDVRLGMDLGVLALYAGYMLLGHCLYRLPPLAPSRISLAFGAWAASSLLVAVATFVTSHRLGIQTEMFFENSDPLVMLAAAASFLVLRQGFRSIHPAWASGLVVRLARASFGVYLCQAFVLARLFDAFGPLVAECNLWFTIPLASLACYAASVALVAVIQRVPVLRLTCPW